MKINLHTHSTWCDGADSPRRIAESAIEKGFDVIGFSSHAMLPADPLGWPLTAAKIPGYAAEIRALAKEFASRIEIRLGVEADYVKGACFPDRKTYAALAPDYIIGSIHFVVAPDGAWACVDENPQRLVDDVREHFGGDCRAFLEAYFGQQREMALGYDFDIIGHPDLCRKFNGRLSYFDEEASWYRAELERTADAFAKSGKIVEINTGAISRGWLDDAYPSAYFRSLLRDRGVRLVLSSDAHSAAALDCAFDRFSTDL